MPGKNSGRTSKPLTREIQISKKLSWLLRHGAESEKLSLQTGGYAKLSDVLSNRNLRSLKVTFDEVREIVQENDKQRFSLIPISSLKGDAVEGERAGDGGEGDAEGEAGDEQDGLMANNPENWLIRANQGHSLKIDSEGLLTPLTLSSPDLPTTVVHGTTHKAWVLIQASGGLKPMGRNHVHFASGLPANFKSVLDSAETTNTTSPNTDVTARPPVISGMRQSSTILIFLDLKRALEAGLSFGQSENGVILTEGNAEGLVSLELCSRVEDRTGEGVLLLDGKVVKEAPVTWGARKGR
ncbi:phosphotransferase KptA/Tpt1 [Acrodontium crateriforme]|uniref:2'-phosphotransferase n=1 Tax=Acrodontium crateriforme TaxID=150365 RepID=A0AAQ3R5S3_9PEZI|nr:phosphotransferase KptA/Tpt1 [Acrodontium crateriforme]